jgi:hypothetical protein
MARRLTSLRLRISCLSPYLSLYTFLSSWAYWSERNTSHSSEFISPKLYYSIVRIAEKRFESARDWVFVRV